MKTLIHIDEFHNRANDLVARIMGALPDEKTIDRAFGDAFGAEYCDAEAFAYGWMERFYAPYSDFRHVYEESR